MELFKNLENHLTVQLLFMFIFTSIFTPIEATCPTEIDSVIQAPNKEIFLFKDDDIWRILNGKTNGPKKIHEVFPDGPNSVAAAVTENGLSVLIEEKTLYGYNQDEGTGAFT
uniref:Uncharacterized protein n=1 Tax=Acrobeloides nanus TaxID=290746 RepID=A0A914D0X5_9BILA